MTITGPETVYGSIRWEVSENLHTLCALIFQVLPSGKHIIQDIHDDQGSRHNKDQISTGDAPFMIRNSR